MDPILKKNIFLNYKNMATIGTKCFNNTSRRSYISTAPFHDYIYNYNGVRLTPLEGANCDSCPIGRILRETGRKLYPDSNPGVKRYLVSVYDSVTFLRGFINPNDDIFAVFNSDKPTYIPDFVPDDDVENYGAPVLTRGNIITSEGFVGVQSTITDGSTYAGIYLHNDTPLVEAGVNYPLECSNSNVTPNTYATLYPNGTVQSISYDGDVSTFVRLTADGNVLNTGNTSTLGNLYVDGNVLNTGNTSTLGNLYVGGNISTIGTLSYATGLRVPEPNLGGYVDLSGATNLNPSSDYKYVRVNASGCRVGSRVFLTYNYITNPGILSAENIDDNGFTIVSTNKFDQSGVQYFIVN